MAFSSRNCILGKQFYHLIVRQAEAKNQFNPFCLLQVKHFIACFMLIGTALPNNKKAKVKYFILMFFNTLFCITLCLLQFMM